MKIRVAVTPCANDLFVFYALMRNKIQARGYEFEFVVRDIDELNKRARHGEYDVTLVSVNAFSFLTGLYQMLYSGATVCLSDGPLLVSRPGVDLSDWSKLRVAAPGVKTTSSLLLGLFYPKASNVEMAHFDDIAYRVAEGVADAGVVIHESRYALGKQGLVVVGDLGQAWQARMSSPLPLAGVAVRRSLPDYMKSDLGKLVAASVKYAMSHRAEALAWISDRGTPFAADALQRQVDSYVNRLSVDLEVEGKAAVTKMIRAAAGFNIKSLTEPLFLR